MHLTDPELNLLSDGEGLGAGDAAARRHLASCAACAHALDRLKEEHAGHVAALARLDHPLPRVSVEVVIARARSRSRRPPGLIAAGIGFLLVAGSAAAAFPGSPVRAYVERFLEPARTAAPVPVARVVDAPPQPAAAQEPAGVAFMPGRDVDIAFDALQGTGSLRLSTVSGSSVRIAHRGGDATYRLTADGVSVDNSGSTADFELAVPMSVSRARVRVGARTVFEKDGATIRTTATRDSTGVYVIPLHVPSTPRSVR